MTSRPRIRAGHTSALANSIAPTESAAERSVALRDARGAVTPPGKKARARNRRTAARSLRELFERAVVLQLQALEAGHPEDSSLHSREQLIDALISHARAVAKRHIASTPRATSLPEHPSPPKPNPKPEGRTEPSRHPARPSALSNSEHPPPPPPEAHHVLARVERAPEPAEDTKDGKAQDALSEAPQVSFREGWRVSSEDAKKLCAFHPEVVLVSPQIPPNTGTVARLCGALCAKLHLVEPLGFDVSEKAVRRAGLDYWDEVDITVHGSLEALKKAKPGRRWVLVETGGTVSPSQFAFAPGDLLLFGSETKGLPAHLVEEAKTSPDVVVLTIPMYSGRVRSLNLANTVSMALFAAVENLRERFLEPKTSPPSHEGTPCPS